MRDPFPFGLLENDCDAIIIGAGPAGSTAAAELAGDGRKTLVLEARGEVGSPVRCAEYIPAGLSREIDIPAEAIAQKVEFMWTFVNGELVAESRLPGITLNRAAFDQSLAKQAVELGAKLLTRCRVVSLSRDMVLFRGYGQLHSVKGQFIIGADGPLSITGRSADLTNRDFIFCLQVEVPLRHELRHTQVHFRPELYGGYGWVFPKGRSANVGIGVRHHGGARLPRLLGAFLTELEEKGVLRRGPILRRTGGLIPAGGPLQRTVYKNKLLVGDAAGHADPITGSGIPAAISGGRMAGQAVTEALRIGNPQELCKYEESWRAHMNPSLERARRRRISLEQMWNQGSFVEVIRRNWIAFQGYY